MPRSKVITIFALATLSVAAFAQNTVSARPGTLNYIEGSVVLDGTALSAGSNNKVSLAAGQSLTTENGKAELLLTPGIFLRVGSNSTVEMVSPNLTHTEVKLTQGRANLEVDELYSQNRILIDLPNGQTQIMKRGLYAFDASGPVVSVFDGQANVYPGSDFNTDIKPVEVKGGRRLMLTGDLQKPVKFDKDAARDDLYNWGSLRSEYLGEANLKLAQSYVGSSSFYPGWYWAGGMYGYTWMPSSGLWWNPFGYGFYSPYYLYAGGPIYGGGYPGWYGYRPGFYGSRPGVYGGFRGSPGFRGTVGGFPGGTKGFQGAVRGRAR